MNKTQESSFDNQKPTAEEAMFGSDAQMSHYEMPNLAACLYDYTNKEQDMVYRCFRTGNYDSLRDLPNELAPQQVIEKLKEKITSNIEGGQNPPERDHKGRIVKLAGGGLFHEFEWMPDSFSNFLESQRKDNADSKQVIESIHPKPFVSTIPGTDKYDQVSFFKTTSNIFPKKSFNVKYAIGKE